jgi:hypothetical protein
MSVSASSPAPSNSSTDGFIGDVPEIIAVRTSVSGENDVLDVLKTSWIPVSNLIADGPVLQQFQSTPKIVFSTCRGSMSVYVHGAGYSAPGRLCGNREEKGGSRSGSGGSTKIASDRTPRKALGGVAKRKTTGKD